VVVVVENLIMVDPPKKENFAKTVLEPAARGELQKGHQSGIPHLLGRKRKGHGVHDNFPGRESDDLLEQMIQQDQEAAQALETGKQKKGHLRLGTAVAGSAKLSDVVKYIDDPYDSEEEYDEMEAPMSMEEFENHPRVEKDDAGRYSIEYDSDWGADSDADDEPPSGPPGRRQRQEYNPFVADPEESFFFRDMCDFSVPFHPNLPEEVANRPLPIQPHGSDLDDFLAAVINNPTKYCEDHGGSEHPESLREAKPNFPPNRVNPNFDFVHTNHKRFIYVENLPHPTIDGESGDFENPLFQHEVQRTVQRLFKSFGVKAENVSPASLTSAFIGFKSPQQRDEALATGPEEKILQAEPIVISKAESGDDDADFIKTAASPDAVIKLVNLPPNRSAGYWSHNLFPANTEVGSIYGPLSTENICMISPTTALVKFESADKADSAVSADVVKTRLGELSECRIRYFKAKRELVLKGMTGPGKLQEMFVKGPRLVVDGDAPSKDFFLDHYDVIELRNLHPKVTKKDISNLIQPFCADVRDVDGSVEFVTCAEGNPIGRAYVGFDRLGEIQKVFETHNGRMTMGDNRIFLRKVQEKGRRKNLARESRPLRTEEELLDDLNNWEKHVDPDDIEMILSTGIKKETLDNVMRTIRFSNTSYGPYDQAVSKERFRADGDRGEEYREFIKVYIENLKELLPTKKNPGLGYEALFFPDEEVDVSMITDPVDSRKKNAQEKS